MLIGVAIASTICVSLTAFVMAVQIRFAEETIKAERLRRALLT